MAHEVTPGGATVGGGILWNNGIPGAALGVNGQLCVNIAAVTNATALYQKQAGAWVAIFS